MNGQFIFDQKSGENMGSSLYCFINIENFENLIFCMP